jgi:hypothetical protein
VRLALSEAMSHVATHANPYRFDRDMVDHDRDLLAMFGFEFQERLLRSGRNIEFSELAELALARLPRSAVGSDLVIVAYGVPDLNPTKAVAAHINLLLGGAAFAFAVSEQGLHSPFTALKVINAFADSGRSRKATLFVLEQSTRPHWDELVHQPPLVDSVAVLVFRCSRGYRAGRVMMMLGEETDAVRAELLARIGNAEDEDPLVVVGPWVSDLVVAGLSTVHRVQPGSYATSLWRAVADHHVEWAERHRRIILCDTDPRHHRTSLAELQHAALSVSHVEQAGGIW